MEHSDDHAGHGSWRRAATAAEHLRDRLKTLGVPDHEVVKVRARTDISGNGYVYLGTLSLKSADLLLAAIAETEPAP